MDYEIGQVLSPGIQGLFASVVLLALGSTLFFSFIPIRLEPIQKVVVRYFILYFFCIFSSFFLASLSVFLPYVIVSILTGSVYVIGYHCLRQGFIVRRENQVTHLYRQPYFYLHLFFFIGLGLYLGYSKHLGIGGEFSRIAFLTLNLVVICIFAIRHIYRDPASPTYGERVARVVFLILITFMLGTIAALFMTSSFQQYLVVSVPIQIFNLHIAVLSLCALLLSDTINKHYDNSMTDALTGLPNRRHLMQVVTDTIEAAGSKNQLASMLVADLDYFKKINDRYGHDIGDKAIIAFANTLSEVTPEYMHIGRLGGEEFVIFMPDMNAADAESFAERLRLQTHYIQIETPENSPLHITASFGIATFVMADASTADFLRAADRAMYTAKDNGRDSVSHYAAA